MRLATLQFAPKLGDVNNNINRANHLLSTGRIIGGRGAGIEGLSLDILVLPEMALTGYNFPSLEAIKPFLERRGEGSSSQWARETARRFRCKVCVGYPEFEPASNGETEGEGAGKCYNSLLVVDETGDVIHNYRKSFLYYTDETWAEEGDVNRGFYELTFGEKKVSTSFGICMDINPYKFEAPFTAWEFATRILDSRSQLVIVSMAWLTLLIREELVSLSGKPDMETFNYWIQRFLPLMRKKMGHDVNLDGSGAGEGAKKIVIVFANRCGEEVGEEKDVRYAGTSAVVAVTQKPGDGGHGGDGDGDGSVGDVKILCWDLKGAMEEGICFADTTADPELVFGLVKSR